jgi:hypothetical protein
VGRPQRLPAPCRHRAPRVFSPGRALELDLALIRVDGITGATCYYRHVNQAERFQMAAMTRSGSSYRTTLPADYTNSPYPLQYYFMLHAGPAVAHLYPGLGADRLQMPYFVIRRAPAG